MHETRVFKLKITLWTSYDAHGIPKWQVNHFYSQEHETGAKSLIMYVWQILVSLKGETPFIHGRNGLQKSMLVRSLHLSAQLLTGCWGSSGKHTSRVAEKVHEEMIRWGRMWLKPQFANWS